MDYVVYLIKANKQLLKLVKELQASSQDYYYEKYNKAQEEILNLKDKISTLETQIYSLNKEINKKNIELQKNQNKSL